MEVEMDAPILQPNQTGAQQKITGFVVQFLSTTEEVNKNCNYLLQCAFLVRNFSAQIQCAFLAFSAQFQFLLRFDAQGCELNVDPF